MLSHSSPPAHVRRVPRRLVLFLACTVAYTKFPGVQMGLLCTCNTGITVISHQRRQGVHHASFFLRQGFVITCTLLAKPARQFIQAVQHRTMRSGSPSDSRFRICGGLGLASRPRFGPGSPDDFRIKISDFRFKIPDFRFQSSDLWRPRPCFAASLWAGGESR